MTSYLLGREFECYFECYLPYATVIQRLEPFSGVEIHMEMDMDWKWMEMGHNL